MQENKNMIGQDKRTRRSSGILPLAKVHGISGEDGVKAIFNATTRICAGPMTCVHDTNSVT